MNNATSENLGAATAPAQDAPALPPLAPDPDLDRWVAELAASNPAQKGTLLDSIITHLNARNRFAYASDYAEEWLNIDRSLPILLLAGKTSQFATQLPYIQRDSVLFGRYTDRAITHLREVTTAEPENQSALLSLGVALVTSRRAENSMQGIMTLRKLLELNPDHLEASFQLGVFSLQTGQLEKAVQRFEKVLSLNPTYYAAQFQLALVRLRQQQPEAARALLEQLISEAPDPALKLEANELLQSLN
ncbi:MAG: tetratricopeptide repeat protein [Bacteroidota bacterium]